MDRLIDCKELYQAVTYAAESLYRSAVCRSFVAGCISSSELSETRYQQPPMLLQQNNMKCKYSVMRGQSRPGV